MSVANTSAAQLNIRMSPAIKAAGDATLERMGILPAQIVRAVWQKLALGEEAAGQLLRSLTQKPAVGEAPYSTFSWEDYESHQERREAFWSQIEAIAGPAPEPLPDEAMEELLYEEYLERDRERLVNYAH